MASPGTKEFSAALAVLILVCIGVAGWAGHDQARSIRRDVHTLASNVDTLTQVVRLLNVRMANLDSFSLRDGGTSHE